MLSYSVYIAERNAESNDIKFIRIYSVTLRSNRFEDTLSESDKLRRKRRQMHRIQLGKKDITNNNTM